MRRRGFSLAEVIVAVAVMGLVGVPLLGAISAGSNAGARGSEVQLASVLAARTVDRLLALGYAELMAVVDTERDADLTPLADGAPMENGALAIDGVRFRARWKFFEASPGLVAVTLTVSWERSGNRAARTPGALTVTRLVADPYRASEMRIGQEVLP